MKIATISDTHGCYKNIKFFPRADVFIFAGDFGPGNMGQLRDVFPFAKWVLDLPYLHKIVIAGNHDIPFWKDLSLGKTVFAGDAHFLTDEEIIINGVKFYGSPWTPRFGPYGFMEDDDKLERIWDQIPEDTDVLITHGPPWSILDRNVNGLSCGSKTLFLKTNNLNIHTHIFGHIHEARGRFIRQSGTKCYNVAYDHDQPEFTIIEI